MAQYIVPSDLYFTEDHAWVRVEGDKVRIGISDFTQKLAGEITFIRIPRVGKTLAAGALLFSIQSGKWAGKVKVPLTGAVVESNNELPANPKLLNSDCYGAGWICVLQPENLAAVQSLLHGDAAERFFAAEHVKYAK